MLLRRTRTTISEYANKRRLAKRKCRKRKRIFVKANLDNTEEIAQKQEIRQLYIEKKDVMQEDINQERPFVKTKVET
jgi:hypothetical protein